MGRKDRDSRGYGREHRRLRRHFAPLVAAGMVTCARCGKLIEPGEAWDLGHDDHDRTKYAGPEGASVAGVVAVPESVAEAVRRDLAEIALRAPEVAEGPLAMAALALARELDGNNSATSKSMCARALADVWKSLLELAPPDADDDAIDDLRTRRQERVEGDR